MNSNIGRALVPALVLTLTPPALASAQRLDWPFHQGAAVGVSVRDVEPAEVDRLKVQGGAVIEDVRPDMPGASAGLQRLDVVVEFDGERVRSARQFSRLVQETPPGREVRMAVVREGSRRDLSITPVAGARARMLDDRVRDAVERAGEIPFRFEMPEVFAGQRGRLGITVQQLTPQLAEYFGAKEGVLVSSVADDSAAARAGLQAGDVIIAANGRTIRSHGDLNLELRGAREGDTVRLQIVRDRKEIEVTATIEAPVKRRLVETI